MGRTSQISIGLCLSGYLIALSVASRAAEPEPDELIRQARDKLYTQGNIAIEMLEKAVERSPQNVAYWAEYVYALKVDGRPYFAERASRESLRLHPNNPLLLVARARILQPAPALDVLELLEKQPGHAAPEGPRVSC